MTLDRPQKALVEIWVKILLIFVLFYQFHSTEKMLSYLQILFFLFS